MSWGKRPKSARERARKGGYVPGVRDPANLWFQNQQRQEKKRRNQADALSRQPVTADPEGGHDGGDQTPEGVGVSYDLVFWRQDKPVSESAEAICQRLMGGDRVAGIADLDIESFLSAIGAQFPGAVREPNGESEWIHWAAEDAQSSFQVDWSRQHVVVFCRRTTNADMNRLIDIGVDHGCRLYDPQANERFT